VAKEKTPATPAVHFLRERNAEFETHFYRYEKSGARLAAEKLGIDPHRGIKTLVMEDEKGESFIALMHGDKDVSTKRLARELNVKSVTTCSQRDAQRYTGYSVGGISPFGIRRKMRVFVERSILSLTTLYINAGRRGFIVEMTPEELTRLLDPILVNAEI